MNVQQNFSRVCFRAQFNESNQKKFMALAQKESENSTCERAKTGSVVVTPEGNVAGRGYNSTPPGIISCKDLGYCPRIKYNIPSGTLYDATCHTIHAEVNAISSAGFNNTKKGTLFLFGHYHLCVPCSIMTVRAGIEDVYVQQKATDPIKHLSIQELMDNVNKSIKKGLDDFVKNAEKVIKHK